jgi:hypothetical protein
MSNMQMKRTNWNDIIKKEAKGVNNYSLGEVQEVGPNFILTQKGTVTKSKYYIPKYLVRGFDGSTLWFNVTEGQAETEFKRDMAPNTTDYQKYRMTGMNAEIETWIPAMTNWNEVIKKEAKGMSNFSLGEVQEIGPNFILTQKGTVTKSKYYIPKYLVRGFDGSTLWFNVTEGQAETEFKRETAPNTTDYQKYRTAGMVDVDTWIPTVQP